TWQRIERPSFSTMLAGRLRPVQRALALATVEARKLTAREHGPDDAVGIDVHAARREALRRRFRVVPRHLVVLGERRVGRVRTRHDADDGTRHPEYRAPHRSIRWTRRHAVEAALDPLVLRRVDWIVDADKRIALAVAVGVEHERGPALRLRLVMRLVVDACVEPRDDRAAAREPQLVVFGEIQVVSPEAGVNGRHLLRLRIPHLHLAVVLRDWHHLRGRVSRSVATERRRLTRPDT